MALIIQITFVLSLLLSTFIWLLIIGFILETFVRSYVSSTRPLSHSHLFSSLTWMLQLVPQNTATLNCCSYSTKEIKFYNRREEGSYFLKLDAINPNSFSWQIKKALGNQAPKNPFQYPSPIPHIQWISPYSMFNIVLYGSLHSTLPSFWNVLSLLFNLQSSAQILPSLKTIFLYIKLQQFVPILHDSRMYFIVYLLFMSIFWNRGGP